MPLYDITCDDCGLLEDVRLKSNTVGDTMCCPRCGERMAHRIPSFHSGVFKPFLHTNLAPEDIWITSKKQWKEEATKRGLIAEYLD